ncbi:hypothetical protein PPL_00504 [Heterostelium album PN500]|uniref:RCC1-like domain-containing protein n=1 Tax=Heterostelium pallidum (strain ATCC 26659 / Pp 5 / PN500) TaxID=670386 RepID=D3AWM8_HETP5|nr:hypothetical protein PPL_00504 [Heterostelium album PN500]EFA86701.1 hypothetical protein PPL_00504 [Heterostelium album PN500]|eukprot:XP_020438805.1 hypothetical protein PPL_00504 [Heterostelium album PN500]
MVAAGWGHSLALTDNGAIYGWGWTNDGQLGSISNEKDKPVPLPKEISMEQPEFSGNIVGIYAGSDYSMSLTRDGRLISWGSGEFGQLGHGDCQHSNTPTAINGFEAIRFVSCGFSHTMIIDSKGDLYTFGWNGSGQLGLGDKSNRSVPTLVDPMLFCGEKLKMVAAGRAHSVALTESGRLFTWGSGSKGKLGNGDTSNELLVPTQLYDIDENQIETPKVVNIATGFDHTLIQTKSII